MCLKDGREGGGKGGELEDDDDDEEGGRGGKNKTCLLALRGEHLLVGRNAQCSSRLA